MSNHNIYFSEAINLYDSRLIQQTINWMIFFPEKLASFGDNLHEIKPIFWEKNKKNISKCHLLKFLPSVQRIKEKQLSLYPFYVVLCMTPKCHFR